jgi:hypothetical protein
LRPCQGAHDSDGPLSRSVNRKSLAALSWRAHYAILPCRSKALVGSAIAAHVPS